MVSENSPALDGKELVKLLPFASMNVGEDPFNFINKGEFVDDFKTLGIRYLILSGNPREIVKTPEEAKNWDSLLTLVGKTKGLDKLNWGTEFPVYEIPDSYPHVFSVNKLIGVIGAPLSMKYPSINFEDGIFDASILKDLDPNSFAFYFNGKKTDDLAMSLLTKYFTFPKDAVSSEWAVYSHSEYLKYKYELLQRGINFQDLDYGGGIAFSTILGEKIAFNFNVPTDGEYVLAVRSIDKKAGKNGLIWKLGEPQTLKKGVFVHSISNDSDMVVVNAIALVPLSELESARSLANDYLKRFRVIDGSDLEKYTDYERVSVNNDGTLKYKLDLSNNDFWIIFTDNYSEAWQAAGANTPLIHLPVYGVVNGYYTEGKNSDIEISFTGQKYFRVGVYISITTLATLLLVYYSYEKSLKRRIKN